MVLYTSRTPVQPTLELIVNLTSNQFYGAINRRFDRRITFLSRLGFKHVINEFGAFMVRKIPGRKDSVISTSAILYAVNTVWRDKLAVALHRTGSILPLSC